MGMRRHISKALLAFLLLATFEGVATAAPFVLSYGGRLTEADGKPIEGPIDVEVSFYSSVTGGAPLGSGIQSYSAVPLAQGTFKLAISMSGTDFHSIFVDFTAPVWIELKDATHNKVYPRQRFTSVPFAAVVPVDNKTVTYDATGRLTIAPAATPASGQFLTKDGSGNFVWQYPPSAGSSIAGHPVDAAAPAAGQILEFDGTNWKNSPLAIGTVTAVSASAPFAVATPTTTPVISMTQATSVSSGYLTSSDWAAFNNKQAPLGFTPVNKAGDTFSGPLNMGSNKVTNVGTPAGANDAANKSYVDSVANAYVKKDGSTPLTGDLSAGNHDLTGIATLKLGTLNTGAQNAVAVNPWGTTTGKTGEVHFGELFVMSGHYVGFKAPDSIPANMIWTLPEADGSLGYILQTDGAGHLSWINPSIAAGAVSSVAGKTGTVLLDTDDVPEGSTNLYHTDARARASVVADSLTSGVTDIAPSQNAVFDALATKVDKTGGTLSGALTMSGQNVSGVTTLDSSAIDTTSIAIAPYSSSAGGTGELRLRELDTSAAHSVGFKAPDNIAADTVWTLPAADGAAGQVLKTDGAGQLSWVDVGSLTVADTITDGVTTIAPSQNAVFDALTTKLDLTGGTMSGVLDMQNHKITALAAPSAADDAANKTYADGALAPYIKRDGTTPLTGNWATGGFNITGVGAFSAGATTLQSLTTSAQAGVNLGAYGAGAGQTGELQLQDLSGAHYAGFKAPDTIATTTVWTLPAADGSANYALKTDGSGHLTWASPASLIVQDSISDSVTGLAPSQNAVFDALALKLDKTGGTLTGSLNMGGQAITGLATPTAGTDAATKAYVGTVTGPYLKKDGSAALTGNWHAGNFNITGVGTFTAGVTTVASATSTSQAGIVLDPYGAGAGNTGELRFKDLSGSHYVGLKAPDSIATSQTLVVPATDGSANDILKTNGAGQLGWSSAGSLSVADSIADGVTNVAPSENAVFDALALKLGTAGGSMTGAINMGAQNLTSVGTPTTGTDAVPKSYVDGLTGPYVAKDGSVPLTGAWNVGSHSITGVGTFTAGATTLGTLSTTSQNALTFDPYGVAAGNTAELRYQELAANGSNFVGFKAPDTLAASQVWALPAADGAANNVLKTDGAGNLAWVSVGSLFVQDSITDAVTDKAPSENAVFDALALKLNTTGGSLSGALDLSSHKITSVATPTATTDAANKSYVDGLIAPYLKKDGSSPLTAAWAVGNFNITGVGTFASTSVTTGAVTTSARAAFTAAPYGTAAGQTSEIRWKRLSGSQYVGFKAPDNLAADQIWVLPSADGTANQILTTDGAGNLSWASAATGTVQDTIVDNVTDKAPSQNAVFDALALKMPLAGGTFSGALDLSSNKITNVPTPSATTDLANMSYVDTAITPYLKRDGSTPLTGNWGVGNFNITGVNNAALTSLTTGSLTTSALSAVTVGPYNTTAGSTGEMRFKDITGTHYVGFKAPDSITTSTTLALPAADGTANQIMITDGSGNLGWLTPTSIVVEDAINDNVTNKAPSENAVYDALALKVDKSGSTMSGAISMGTTNKITNVTTPTAATDAANKTYTDTVVSSYVAKNGSTALTSGWAVGGFNITGVGSFSAGATTVQTLGTSAQAAITIPPYSTGAGQTGEVQLKELSVVTQRYVGFKAPDTIATSKTFVLPAGDGTAGQILKTDGAGNLGWTAPTTATVAQAITAGVTTVAPSEAVVATALAAKVNAAGDTMTGALALGNHKITGVTTPSASTDLATKTYADTVAGTIVKRDGTVPMTGALNAASFNLSGIGTLSAGATTVTSLTSSGTIAGTALSSSAATGLNIAPYSTATNAEGEVRFSPLSGSTYVGFKGADTVASNMIWTLPAADGTAGQTLTTDAAGTLSFTSPSATSVGNAVTSGVTNLAPSEDAVYQAAALRIKKAGDTMTGALVLPANGLTVGTSQLVIANNNVGIGETNPGAPLAFATSDGTKIALYQTSGATCGFGTVADTLQLGAAGASNFLNFGYGSSASMTTNFYTHGTSANVGIGTSGTPPSRLSLLKTGTANSEVNMLTLDANNTGNGSGVGIDFKDTGSGYLAGIDAIQEGTNDGRLEFRTSGATSAATTSRLTSTSTRMTILSGGNVGIGTSAPAGLLHILKTGTAADTPLLVLDSNNGSANAGSSIQFKNANSGNGYLAAIAADDDGTANGRLSFRTSSDGAKTGSALTTNSDRLVVKPNGSIGIGATYNTVIYPLQFATSLGDKLSLWGNSGNHYGFGIQNALMQIHTDAASDNIVMGYGPSASLTETARFTGDGKLGVATNNPDSAVHFPGGMHINRSSDGLGMGVGVCPYASCSFDYESLQLTAGDNLRIWFGTTERFILGSDGRAYKGGTLAWDALSDIRTKNVKRNYTLGLKEILALQPILYSYRQDNPMGYDSKPEYVGFSAQDVQKVIPNAVKEGDDGYLRLTADPIFWAMLNGLKEEHGERLKDNENMQSAIDTAEATIHTLRASIQAKDAEYDELEAAINQLKATVCRGLSDAECLKPTPHN